MTFYIYNLPDPNYDRAANSYRPLAADDDLDLLFDLESHDLTEAEREAFLLWWKEE